MLRHFIFLTLSIIFLTAACSEEATQTPREPFAAITALPTASQTPITTFINKNWTTFDDQTRAFFVSKMHMKPISGAHFVTGEALKAKTYSQCSFSSQQQGEPLSVGTDISENVIGKGIGPCAGWFVMQSYSEETSDNPQEYVWIPGESIMRVSPETPAREVMKVAPPVPSQPLTLLPLIACDQTGWWQGNFNFGNFGYMQPMSKMEFHADLSQVLEDNWIDDFADLPEYIDGKHWRGGFSIGNRNFNEHSSNIGWDGTQDGPTSAFIWRYISPDKTPTKEANYGVEIIGAGGFWSARVELSRDCYRAEGEVSNLNQKRGSFSAYRMEEDRRDSSFATDTDALWSTLESQESVLFPKICNPIGDWRGYVIINGEWFRYLRVFLPDGYGYEWLLSQDDVWKFGLERDGINDNGWDQPVRFSGDNVISAIPFWWAIDGDTVFYRAFSNALSPVESAVSTSGVVTWRSPVHFSGATELLELIGCHTMYADELTYAYKTEAGELAYIDIDFSPWINSD